MLDLSEQLFRIYNVTTSKRKTQYRESSAKHYKNKKAEGFVPYKRLVKPEWKLILDSVLDKLKGMSAHQKIVNKGE